MVRETPRDEPAKEEADWKSGTVSRLICDPLPSAFHRVCIKEWIDKKGCTDLWIKEWMNEWIKEWIKEWSVEYHFVSHHYLDRFSTATVILHNKPPIIHLLSQVCRLWFCPVTLPTALSWALTCGESAEQDWYQWGQFVSVPYVFRRLPWPTQTRHFRGTGWGARGQSNHISPFLGLWSHHAH